LEFSVLDAGVTPMQGAAVSPPAVSTLTGHSEVLSSLMTCIKSELSEPLSDHKVKLSSGHPFGLCGHDFDAGDDFGSVGGQREDGDLDDIPHLVGRDVIHPDPHTIGSVGRWPPCSGHSTLGVLACR
jgi:hypothetical protein